MAPLYNTIGGPNWTNSANWLSDRPLGEWHDVTTDGERVTTLVIFGEDDSPALLGAYTLEGLALAVDPVEQRLVPTHLILY